MSELEEHSVQDLVPLKVTDPYDVTKYDRTDSELEEFLIFGMLVAGKGAVATANSTRRFYERLRLDLGREDGELSPLELIREYLFAGGDISTALKEVGIGCHSMKGKALAELASMDLPAPLREISLTELTSLSGVGPKTARFFILHSRPNARVACLDVHIMKFLAAMCPQYRIPVSTPTPARYPFFEGVWLEICDALSIDSASLDFLVWQHKGNREKVLQALKSRSEDARGEE